MESNYIKKNHTVKIAGRVFQLAFPLSAMLEMRNSIDGFEYGEIENLVRDPDVLLKTLYILARNGALLAGEKLDVDQDWFGLHIPVNIRKMIAIQLTVLETIADWMNMETEEDENREREVDLVLQEIQKKSVKTSSPGEKSQPGD